MNDYMKKTLKVSLYGIKSNKVFIALMLLLSPCLLIVWGGTLKGADYIAAAASVLGVLLPIVMFGYVHDRTECDFYNSMPIKRSQYFLGYLISCVISFFIVYVPLFIMLAASVGENAENFFCGIAVFFVIFASTVLAIMLSGSLFSTLVTLAVLNAAAYVIAYSLFESAEIDYGVYLNIFRTAINALTPFAIASVCCSDSPEILDTVLLLLMAAVNLAAAFFLHRFRKNESTLAIAFPKTRYIIQYAAMLLVALFESSLIDNIIYLGYPDAGERTFGFFIEKAFRQPYFFPYTFIAVFVTFVITNMIFENNPRGALKKIRHFFIFSIGYSAFYLLIVGGLLYTRLPYTFVPFDSDMVFVSVYRYEEKGRVAIDSEQDEYYYNESYFTDPPPYDAAAGTKLSANAEETETAVSEFEQPAAAAPEKNTFANTEFAQTNPPVTDDPTASYFQNIIYSSEERGKWITYNDNNYTYYLRMTDTVVYAVTDKEYIDYLSGRVRKTNIRRSHLLGYLNVLTDTELTDLSMWTYDWEYKTVRNGAYICNVLFYDMDGKELEKYISLMERDVNNIDEFDCKNRYTINTFLNSEEDMEEVRSHAAYSVVFPEPPLK